MSVQLPLLLSPEDLASRIGDQNLLIIDLGKEQVYDQAHVPGAIHLPFPRLMRGGQPAPGLLPDREALSELFSELGLKPETQVVAYDDEGGGWAGRLLWTLETIGHHQWSYLDGGIHAWLAEGLPTESAPNLPRRSEYVVGSLSDGTSIDLDALVRRLGDEKLVIWDARSEEEYAGVRAFAARGGHIPGARHYEWTEPMDRSRHLRLRDLEAIRGELAARGITADREVVTHCQTHHRSGFTWLVGRILGLNIRAYAGSWAEWGNHPDTPVEKY